MLLAAAPCRVPLASDVAISLTSPCSLVSGPMYQRIVDMVVLSFYFLFLQVIVRVGGNILSIIVNVDCVME